MFSHNLFVRGFLVFGKPYSDFCCVWLLRSFETLEDVGPIKFVVRGFMAAISKMEKIYMLLL